jgi:hypothetical protein
MDSDQTLVVTEGRDRGESCNISLPLLCWCEGETGGWDGRTNLQDPLAGLQLRMLLAGKFGLSVVLREILHRILGSDLEGNLGIPIFLYCYGSLPGLGCTDH